MNATQVEYARQLMQQKWYELVMAEQRGAAMTILERLYNAYTLALEEYNRSSAQYQREHVNSLTPAHNERTRLAS